MEENSIFRQVANYKELHVYQKAEVLVLLTDVFCKRFLPLYGDRRVDQMNMAARCGKQNIVEGCEDGQTSSEMEVKLVNVGRGSFQELREDYEDYLKRNSLPIWGKKHPRFNKMVAYCRENNFWEAYQPLAKTLPAEDFCNMALTLCHITDKMFCGYLKHLHAVRTGYRQEQDARMRALETENAELKKRIAQLEQELAALRIGD